MATSSATCTAAFTHSHHLAQQKAMAATQSPALAAAAREALIARVMPRQQELHRPSLWSCRHDHCCHAASSWGSVDSPSWRTSVQRLSLASTGGGVMWQQQLLLTSGRLVARPCTSLLREQHGWQQQRRPWRPCGFLGGRGVAELRGTSRCLRSGRCVGVEGRSESRLDTSKQRQQQQQQTEEEEEGDEEVAEDERRGRSSGDSGGRCQDSGSSRSSSSGSSNGSGGSSQERVFSWEAELEEMKGQGTIMGRQGGAGDDGWRLFPASRKSVDDVAAFYRVDVAKGLDDAEVARRRELAGWNELNPPDKTPIWQLLLAQFNDTLVRILIIAAVISFGLAVADSGEAVEGSFEAFTEPLIIVAIVLLNAVVGVSQEVSSERSLEALKVLQPQTCRVLRCSQLLPSLPSRDLVPGDIVELRAGDSLPADVRIAAMKSAVIRANQAALTGESEPQLKQTEAVRGEEGRGEEGRGKGDAEWGEERGAEGRGRWRGQGEEEEEEEEEVELVRRENMLFAGTTVVYGTCLGIVIRTGMATEMGKLQAQLEVAGKEEYVTPLSEALDGFSDLLTKVVGAVCLLLWLSDIRFFLQLDEVTGSWGVNVEQATYHFKEAVALAVAAIPEGLPAVITTCLALGTQRMAAESAVVRHLPSVETLGCTTVICSDKTGTLTTNQMAVAELAVPAGGGSSWDAAAAADASADMAQPQEGAAADMMVNGAGADESGNMMLTWRVSGTTYDPRDGEVVGLHQQHPNAAADCSHPSSESSKSDRNSSLSSSASTPTPTSSSSASSSSSPSSSPSPPLNLLQLARIASLCNDAGIVRKGSRVEASGMATEAALKVVAEKIGLPSFPQHAPGPAAAAAGAGPGSLLGCCEWWQQRSERLFTLDFDRQRKSMSVLVRSFQTPTNSNGSAGAGAGAGAAAGAAAADDDDDAAEAENELLVKGAPEYVISKCSSLLLPDGSLCPLSPPHAAAILSTSQAMANSALRVLAFAVSSHLPPPLASCPSPSAAAALPLLSDPCSFAGIESNLTFVGLAGIQDPPRPEVAAAVEDCRRAGIRVVVITGDNQKTAEAVCRTIGLGGASCGANMSSSSGRGSDSGSSGCSHSAVAAAPFGFQSLVASEFVKLPLSQQLAILQREDGGSSSSSSSRGVDDGSGGGGGREEGGEVSRGGKGATAAAAAGVGGERAAAGGIVFSRAEPSHKQLIVQLLRQQGEVVAMTGDGVNDAPALKMADVGIAMGVTGTEVAKEASDVVLADDNFATIVVAVREGRAIYDNMRSFIRYLISSNIGEVIAIFIAAALSMPQPFLPVQLLWVNLVGDGAPAIALGFNPPEPGIMNRRPRSRSEPLIDGWALFRYLAIGAYVGMATVGVFGIWNLAPEVLSQWFNINDGHTAVTLEQLTTWSACSSWSDFSPTAYTAGGEVVSLSDPCKFFTTGQIKPSTLALSTLVLIEMFVALSSVSENASLFHCPPWRNKWLLLAVSTSLGLHLFVLYTPLSRVFVVVPLSLEEWAFVLVASAPVLVVDEVLKFLTRRFQKRR